MSDEQLVILYGAVGDERGRTISVRVDSEGRLDTLAHLMALDPNNRRRQIISDLQGLLRTRPYEPYRTQAIQNLGAAWAVIYTCPANSTAKVMVTFGQTIGGTTDYEAALRVKTCVIGLGLPVYIDAPSPTFGPYILTAGDIIHAYRTAGVNGAALVDIELYSTGDVNTGI